MFNTVYDGSDNQIKMSNTVVTRCLVRPAQSLEQGGFGRSKAVSSRVFSAAKSEMRKG